MAQEVLKSRTKNMRLWKLIYAAVQYANRHDAKKLSAFSSFENLFISDPSHPLSGLVVKHKKEHQSVTLYPHALWFTNERMQGHSNFFGLPFISFVRKEALSDFYRDQLESKLHFRNEIDSWPSNSVLIFLEYIEPIVRKDEYTQLYVELLHKLQTLGHRSFLLKFHPRSTQSDNKFFVRKLKSKLSEEIELKVVPSCLDIELWVNVFREEVQKKVVAAGSVWSTAAEVFSLALNKKAYYSPALAKLLCNLNNPRDAGEVSLLPPQSEYIIHL
jgi:hypothetical protein